MTHKQRAIIARAKIRSIGKRGWYECQTCGMTFTFRTSKGQPKPD